MSDTLELNFERRFEQMDDLEKKRGSIRERGEVAERVMEATESELRHTEDHADRLAEKDQRAANDLAHSYIQDARTLGMEESLLRDVTAELEEQKQCRLQAHAQLQERLRKAA